MATKVLNTKIIIRNDTAVNFVNENPTLLKGEIALELDTKKYKIGNGISNYVDLPYYNHLDDGKNNKINQLIRMLDDEAFGSVSDIKVNGSSVLNTSTKVASITIASISYEEDTQSVVSDKLTNNNITLHRIAKTGSWNDLLNKPNIVNSLDSASASDLLSANQGRVLKSMIQAIPQATSYKNTANLIAELNSSTGSEFVVGHNLYILELGVPDFWISEVSNTPKQFTGTSQDLVNSIKLSGSVQIGYYKISMLETEKVELSQYVTTTQLNEAISALGIDSLKTKVADVVGVVGNDSKGLVKDVNDLKRDVSSVTERVDGLYNDDTIIRTTDFVVLNGGDSTTAN